MAAPERPDQYRYEDGRWVSGPDVPTPAVPRSRGLPGIILALWITTSAAAFGLGLLARPAPSWQQLVLARVAEGCLPVLQPVGVGADGARLEVLGRQQMSAAKASYIGGVSMERDFELHVMPVDSDAIRKFNPDAYYVGAITLESCLPGAS